MKDLKFRCWDKQHKIMANVTMLLFDTNELDHDQNANEPKNMEHFELMQFTGLKDKNGKEIFEGDIYIAERGYMSSRGYKSKKYPDRIKVRCTVQWSKFESAWWPNEIGPIEEHKEADENAPYHYYFTGLSCSKNGTANWIEVIGNIYEHPHLLK